MKIATWNVNSVKARWDHLVKWLETAQPDVVMLQELKGLDFPHDDLAATGYRAEALGQKAYNGVATLSRLPMTRILDRLPGDDADEQARYLEVDIGGIRCINIYAPNGNPVDSPKFPYKLQWLDRLVARATALREQGVAFAIGGDYNIIPEDRDCYNPQAWVGDALFRPESRRLYRTLCNLGLTDALRVFQPGPGVYTFWDYTGGAFQNDKGIRIDHFLVSPTVADRLTGCGVDRGPRGWEKASDHTPVVMSLRAA